MGEGEATITEGSALGDISHKCLEIMEGESSRIQSGQQVQGDTVAGSHKNMSEMKARGWQPR